MIAQRMIFALGQWRSVKVIMVNFLLITSLQAYDDHDWRFGGTTYGVKAWFWVTNECKDNGQATVRVKLENTKAYPVEFHFRIKNSYWKKNEEKILAPNSIDSTYQYTTDEKTCRVQLDRLWGKDKE